MAGAGVLKVIDGATSSVVSAITLDPQAVGVAVNPQINRAYVTHGSNPGVPGKVSVLGLEGDGDYDGFADSTELFVGTDAVDACANTPAADDEGLPDAWPFDHNDNQRADLSDVLGYIPVFNSFFPIAPYEPRFDLDASGGITLADVLSYIPVFNLTCGP